MSSPRSAVALLRSLDLMPDGPLVWGQPIPSRSPGIFLVEVPARTDAAPIDITAVRAWVERVPSLLLDGERPTPTELADRLSSFWLPQETILYVGRTSKSLGPRVAALMHTPLGDRRPHPGGHWLKTMRDVQRLRIWWAETDAPEEYEDAVVSAIASEVSPEVIEAIGDRGPVLPWANLGSVTGERRATGITASLLADGDASGATRPTASTAPKRPTTTRPTAGKTTRATSARPATRARASAAAPPRQAVNHMTAAGLVALQAELERLTRVRRPEVILRVKSARELGDLRENADYEAARNEQSFLEGRIREVEQLLKMAVVIKTVEHGAIALGSTVVAEADGELVTLAIVGTAEADPSTGRVSDASPVGKALMGRRAGDEIVVRTPGREIHYRVVEVTRS